MKIRRRVLPPGWYPGDESETRLAIRNYLRGLPAGEEKAWAGVVPHAGWEFSGKVALEVFSCLIKNPATIVVVGGHLGPHDGILAAFEDAYETPLGIIEADLELLEEIGKEVILREDRYGDNTVEIQLPFIKYLFPDTRVLSFRAAPARESIELGRAIRLAAEKSGRQVAVIGSTDLTHYGNNYGFQPAGEGKTALKWVKEINDRGFIERMLEMNGEEALRHARENHSACSAGGAVAALAFARQSGYTRSRLLRYLTSYDVHPSESFVGYAGIIYS